MNKKGFTIVELMIATMVFSVILLIMTSGLIYIGRVYYRTVAQNKTQEAARSIIDEVSQSIQFSGGPVTVGDDAICVGNIMYAKTENVIVSDSTSGLRRGGHTGNCEAANLNMGSEMSELVPEGMFLNEFNISPDVTTDTYNVSVQLVSVPNDEDIQPNGESELFDGSNCRGGPGSEYCATSRLETTVKKRL